MFGAFVADGECGAVAAAWLQHADQRCAARTFPAAAMAAALQAARANAIAQAAGMGERVSFQVGGKEQSAQLIGAAVNGLPCRLLPLHHCSCSRLPAFCWRLLLCGWLGVVVDALCLMRGLPQLSPHYKPSATCAPLAHADALNQPFSDGEFDLVWSMESGEHMPGGLYRYRTYRITAGPAGERGTCRVGCIEWMQVPCCAVSMQMLRDG